MDIEELGRFESVYNPGKEVAFCWLRKQYVQLSTEENHTEIVDHANDSLRIWQAAQAVPEGFVVLAIDDMERICRCLDDHAVYITYKASDALESIQKAMIEAQQPSSTSDCPDEP